jgi:hypothetical protein
MGVVRLYAARMNNAEEAFGASSHRRRLILHHDNGLPPGHGVGGSRRTHGNG